MSEPVVIGNATLYCGGCIDILRTLPDNSIEACLTDPPYGLSNHTEADIRACMSAWLAGKPYQHGKAGFMGKDWDSFVPGPEMWKELYRVLKPGAHLLVFAGTRTADLMSLALRLAGFEAREMCLWVFGAGFPKALDVSAAIDKMKGMEREVVGLKKNSFGRQKGGGPGWGEGITGEIIQHHDFNITAPASPEAAQWDGWKSSLKPCYEPILLFRKPLDGTIAETVLKWGTGGLNVDGCRIGINETEAINSKDFRTTAPTCSHIPLPGNSAKDDKKEKKPVANSHPLSARHNAQGRYPGNLIVSSDEEVEKCFPAVHGSGDKRQQINPAHNGYQRPGKSMFTHKTDFAGYHDSGSASRFFQHCDFTMDEIAEMNGIELKRIVYSGKASKRDRDEGCEGMEERDAMDFIGSGIDGRGNTYETQPRHNHHPTCKPSSLLRYCLRMITPPGATVIDPFFGSGSTGKAALLEGFNVIGIEREPEYFEIAQARCAYVSPDAFTVQPTPRKAATASQQSTLFEEAA